MKRLLFISLILIITAGLFFSCKEDSSTEPERSDPTSDYQIIEGDEGTIGAAGGKITVPTGNGNLSGAFVDIPEGALSQNREIKISLASTSEKNPESSNPAYIKFSPSNTSFKKPVTIGLPIKQISSSSNVSAFYFDGSDQVNEIFVQSVSTSGKIATAETDHFSVYYAADKKLIGGAFMGIDRLKMDGKPGVRISDIGGVGGSGLHHVYSRDNKSNALMSLTQGTAKYAHIRFCLFKKNPLFDDQIGDCQAFVIEKVADDGSDWQIKVKDYYDNKTLYSRYISELDDEINTWFSGLPLVCKFNEQIDNNSEYYLKIQWFLSPSSNREVWLSANTMVYEFGTKKNAQKVSQMTSYSNDVNNNFIDDDYEGTSINYPPSIPLDPTPEDDEEDVSIYTSLNWSCEDPDDDPLTYDIYLGKTNPPSLYEEDFSSTGAFNPGELEEGTEYFWYVVAKDDHQNSTKGDLWKFTTEGGGTTSSLPFYDGFESGDLTTGGWIKSGNLNIVSQNPYEGNRVLEGNGQWSIVKKFDADVDFLSVSAALKVSTTTSTFSLASVSVGDIDLESAFCSIWLGGNQFLDNNAIAVYYGNGFKKIGNYSANTWYNLRIDINTTSNTFNVYINDELKESDLDLITSGTPGSVVIGTDERVTSGISWADDVKVEESILQMRVTQPDSSTIWKQGDYDVPIRWETGSLGGYVNIELYNGSNLVETIYNNAPNDGSYNSWFVPQDIEVGTNYRVKISSSTETNSYAYSDYFEIAGDGIIKVLEPSSSTEWQQGQDDVTISWETGEIGGDVSIELYKGNSLVETIISSTSNNGSYNTWDLPDSITVGTNYRVKVSSTTQTDSYDFSEYFEIKAKPTPPSAPTLSTPSNNSMVQAINPTLSWNTSSGATSYTLQVSINNNFTSFVFNQSGLTGTSEQITGLNNNKKYYWRVRATNSFGTSNWSSVWSFTTKLTPLSPTLSSPINGASDQELNLILSWNASSGADSYALQVSRTSTFSNLAYNQSGLTNTSQQVTGLNNNKIYYWRVRAINSYGTSEWSQVWTFNTKTIMNIPCPGLPTISYAGKNYNTVLIGSQCWLKRNLDYEVENSWCYGNNPTNCETYGRLYSWDAAMNGSNSPGAQGICPPGWHIPTRGEFESLSRDVSGDGNALKAIGQGYGDGAGTNRSGFEGLLGGIKGYGYAWLRNIADFWTSTGYGDQARDVTLVDSYDTINIQNSRPKTHGMSIRCIKD